MKCHGGVVVRSDVFKVVLYPGGHVGLQFQHGDDAMEWLILV
jgi:hypothetical protein